jgi:hypothetical protein
MNSDDPDYGVGMPPCLDALDAEKNNQAKSIAIVSNVPSEKSEGFISQSMEKLLDGIVPEEKAQEYTIVLLAKPIKRQLDSKNRLYELYTALAPYTTWQTGYTYTESDGVSSSANFGVNLGVGAGANATVNSSQGTSIANAVQKGSSDTLGGHVGGKHLGGIIIILGIAPLLILWEVMNQPGLVQAHMLLLILVFRLLDLQVLQLKSGRMKALHKHIQILELNIPLILLNLNYNALRKALRLVCGSLLLILFQRAQ